MPNITTVISYSVLTAVVTGFGVLPLMFRKAVPARWMSLASALASGLLLAAAFELIHRGIGDNAAATIIGIEIALSLIAVSRQWLENRASYEAR